jgi:hypothetical protein
MVNENNSPSSPAAMNSRATAASSSVGPGAGSRSPKYYVALDLGSESMAACYCPVGAEQKLAMIPLQHYAKDLIEAGAPLYLKNGSEISTRLRTRFNLRDGDQEEARQPSLNFVHAGKTSPDEYRKSVFEFFHPENARVLKLMPNPKIVFQRGAQDAIPKVLNTEGVEKQYSASDIIQWLTVQVVNNFVLQSPQLKAVSAQDIELILTVPNVYSITHVESLRRFVADHTGVAAVNTVFESDAVAAYATNRDEDIFSKGPEAKRFYQSLINANRDGKPLELVTFDMGRGTTDASIVVLEQPVIAQAGDSAQTRARWRHYQKARTGRSEAGNKLTHIFIEYFEQAVRVAYTAAGVPRPYSFVQRPPSEALPLPQRVLALEKIEAYVQAIKATLSENYEFSEHDYAGLAQLRDQAIIELVINSGSTSAAASPQPAGASEAGNIILTKLLAQALTLPRSLSSGVLSSLTDVFRRRNTVAGQLHRARRKLIKELQQYVERNVVALITDLKAMGEAYEDDSYKARADEKSAVLGPDRKSTARFAIVAGQGTQFGPVRRALRRALNDELQIAEIRFLTGKEAKECCCQGAAAFYANLIDPMNDDHLHGTFAVLSMVVSNDFQYVPVLELMKGEWETPLPVEGRYVLCFSPKRFARRDVEEILADDSWTFLHTFQGGVARLKYDAGRRQLLLNGSPVTLQPYGVTKELYAQLWPESLPVAAEEAGSVVDGNRL